MIPQKTNDESRSCYIYHHKDKRNRLIFQSLAQRRTCVPPPCNESLGFKDQESHGTGENEEVIHVEENDETIETPRKC